MGISESITTEEAFRSQWPGHADAVFGYVQHDPAHRPWVFARAVVRRPYLATVLFEAVASSGERTELWLSVASDGDDGWSIQPVLKDAARG